MITDEYLVYTAVLIESLRRLGSSATQLARPAAATIRLKLLNVGARARRACDA